MREPHAAASTKTGPDQNFDTMLSTSDRTNSCTINIAPYSTSHPISHSLSGFYVNGHEINELSNGKEISKSAAQIHDTEAKAFEEDLRRMSNWPPRSYQCSFCHRLFTSAQALGGHMNIHRRDRARSLLHATGSIDSVSSCLSISSESLSFHEAGAPYRCGELSSGSAKNAHTFSFTAACAGSNHDVCQAHDFVSKSSYRRETTTAVNAVIPPVTAALLQLSPLHKERCRFLSTCIKGRTMKPTKTCNMLQQCPNVCLNVLPTEHRNAFQLCKQLSKYADTRSLLKDTMLSSCNIIDLELRLGPKRAA
ncbi:hypothetical protein L7F22_011804 [Adiantum nelumboides]|nr:hypothetical protein [Adiantum nelumboides]MCO5558225.1 hypothetical protein [Adiantum nelumboides]